jgi:UDP:flavonoid glycosyltransferase YjiC (YdhE family)
MEAMGVAAQVTYDELQTGSTDVLAQALYQILTTSRFRRNAEQMAHKSASMHGSRQAARLLESYAHRVLAY